MDGVPVSGTTKIATVSEIDLPGGLKAYAEGKNGEYEFVIRDERIPGFADLREFATFPEDPIWRVEARYLPRGHGQTVEVEIATNLGHSVPMPTPAELVLTIEGEDYSLTCIEPFEGYRLVTFRDETSGSETPEMGRWILLPEDVDYLSEIDLNRVVLPWHVVSPAFPCPLPNARNRLPMRVEAGEKSLVRDS
ncbi:DUF1684 domain-containing protein [Amycolatopsis thailandensis]|uniref:DUF1684 domain-containing protein n=1 Tax=Amycolatopsis thailandensis TaxID=589330 RepID=UPI0036259D71